MSKKTTIATHDISESWWGLRRSVSACFGARLVQEGNRLHYLADRANFNGQFCDADLRHLDQSFPGIDETAGVNAHQR
ncbi:YeeU protein (antitoxin to YeeV) [Klebsiella michiganensis]|uniref:YeeU protein (Antitoxin to YeeV) n=1 Tax=Klebsiella michiganensis TaxID=1134687 RepID=A0A7H4PQA5_9ENTR|nr:YeeU protein (antitoxin to YeeV) [Klebsiella michiganensis]